jgi:hypothetical protein
MQTLSNPALSPSTPSLPPAECAELDFVICCARVKPSPATIEQFHSLLQVPLDWQKVLNLATQNCVVPLVYRQIQTLAPLSVPPHILQQFRATCSRNAFRNLSLTAELMRLIALLEQHGVPCVAFKGAVLAADAYGDLTLRQFSDLDLFVHPQNFRAAKDILTTHAGYSAPGQHFLTEAERQANFQSRHEYPLFREDGSVSIDLHCQLTGGTFIDYPFTFEDIWGQLQSVTVAHQELLTFCPEDLLLYLCTHGAKSYWTRLSWVCDVAELIRTYPALDWESVLAKSQTGGLERILLVGVLLAKNILGCTLPASVVQRLSADPQVAQLAAEIEAHLKHPSQQNRSRWIPRDLYFRIRSLDRRRDRLQCIQRAFWINGLGPLRRFVQPTAKDLEFFALPPFLYGLLYLVRPLRLLQGTLQRFQK